MRWQRRAAERILAAHDDRVYAMTLDGQVPAYTLDAIAAAERIIREEADAGESVMDKAERNERRWLVDDLRAELEDAVALLNESLTLLRRFEAGDNYFAADCRAFLTRHGGER